MSQSLFQPGGMTQECALIIRIMTCTSNKDTMSQILLQPGGMTHKYPVKSTTSFWLTSDAYMNMNVKQIWSALESKEVCIFVLLGGKPKTND